MTLLRLDACTYTSYRSGLAHVLCETVAAGGAVGFMHPLSHGDALAFWDRHSSGLAAGTLDLFVAAVGGHVAGTVSLDCAMPPNQPHRGDICKMMVSPAYRRQGIAQNLLAEAERAARGRGLTLLVLDTRTGDAAQTLYAGAGFEAVGEIPGYAYNPDGSGAHGTTVMYRRL